MYRTKLDAWADRLLDTGKRNNLIHFRDAKTSTAEILIPGADDLFEKIDGSASFEIFDPKIQEPDEDTGEDNGEGEPEDADGKAAKGKEAWLSLYAPRIRRQDLSDLSRGQFFVAISRPREEYSSPPGIGER